MVTRTLADLIKDLADRRRLSEPPPVVLLGAGASAGAGVSTMQSLYQFVGVPGFDEFVAYIETRTDNERYRLLSEFLQTQDPLQVTPGYQALATLCEKAYFDVVLTTNFDPLLDDALVTAGMRRRDYMLLINGVLRSDRLRWLLTSRSPRVKVLKMHGDLFHRFMAWTPVEMEQYLDDVQGVLGPILSTRDFIVVGNSLRDVRIRGLVEQAGGAVWFITPGEVPPEASQLRDLRAVTGPDLTFEKAFPALADGLGLGAIAPPAAALAAEAQHIDVNTTDDLIAATVGLAPSPEGHGEMTGFLLDAPRAIITDGYSGNRFDPNAITVITTAGRRFTTRGKKMLGHPFGPWVLEVPPELHTTCLRLNPAALSPNETVHIAVAAGERVGLSTGHAVSAVEVDLRIEPVGIVHGLVEIRAAVSPGASGAPVVDASMNVRGFVVAGSTDPNNPVTYIYPARQWAAQIGDAPAPPRKPVRRAKKRKERRPPAG
jgi:SIR2-like domain